MNKRQILFAAVLAAVNVSRSNAIAPANQAFGAIKDDALPEAARPAIIAARTSLNGLLGVQLTELPADAQTALNGALDALVAEEAEKLAEAKAPELAKTTLNGLLASGDYVAKADHAKAVETAVTAARADGEQAAVAKFKVAGERRTQVTACGLPVTNDAVLEGTDDDFKSRLETAKSRAGEAAKLTLNGKPLAGHLNPFAAQAEWDSGFASAKTAFEVASAALGKVPDHAGGGGNGNGAAQPKFA